MPDQALLSSSLEEGVGTLVLQDLYHTADMVFDQDQDRIRHATEKEEHLQEAVWEHHQKLQDIPVLQTEHVDELSILSERTPHLGGIQTQQRGKSHSVTFVNPFYGGPRDNGAAAAAPVTIVADGAYHMPPDMCNHDDEEAADQVVFQDWDRQFQNSAVAPGHFMTMPALSHPHGVENVYQEIGAQISRRFSLACPVASGLDLTHPSTFLPLPLPQPMKHRNSTALQFVMEDPSGKENAREDSVNGLEQGRRHSLGAPHLYCCPWTGCNKVFNRFYNLRSHYRIHSGERPYTCNYCEAAFARNHDLKRHERIHLKTKPFVCPTCHKSFSRNDAMNRHIRLNSCSRPAA